MLVVGAALATVGLAAASHDRTRLLSQVDPALQYAAAYGSALVDQSAGARLYAEEGGPQALQSYHSAIAAARTARTELAGVLMKLPDFGPPLDRVDASVAAWQARYIQPEIARRGQGVPKAASTLAFTRIRRQLGAIEAGLGGVRAGAVRGFDDALNLLIGLVIAVFAGVAVLLVVVWLAIRHSVLAPLTSVSEDSRAVTAGDFDHVVAATGPLEIAGLALEIDAMRSRVVDDLHALETAHAELAQQRKELEERGVELARSNRDLEQFAYVASHDLQEPLRKVAAFCQLLSDRYHNELDDKGQQYIEFAVDGAKRMQSLVNDLLSFSRVGRTKEGWTAVALGDVAAVAVSNLDARIEAAGAKVTIHGPLPTVVGDATLLGALFQNLVGNALKFRGDDPPVVDVTSERIGDDWRISVADNGIGIEARYAERVFVIFQRLHAREQYEGTGIGLALCRKIVEFHGGQIAVLDRPPPGTTIWFTLPAPTPDHEEPRA
jgi:signal transduction histidine kinase